MIRWLLRRKIAAFERAWNYDSTYMREVLDADPRALMVFAKVMGLTQYHKDVPLGAYYAVKIVGTMAEDCGPCTQLAIDMAERAGVDAAALRALVGRDRSTLPEDMGLAAGFAEANLRHAPEADALRGFALTAARIFPTLKYALGHGRACQRVTVGGESKPVPVSHAA